MINYDDKRISLIVPAKNASAKIELTLLSIFEFFEKNSIKNFEVILVINNSSASELVLMKNISEQILNSHSNFKYILSSAKGKGEAIKDGFLSSSGEIILFTDADLPYSLDFFISAIAKIKNGTSLVTGNRRHPQSVFKINSLLLNKAISRNNKSKYFNAFTRKILQIPAHDTQAGIKALTRELAHFVFSRDACPGFLFDLELFLSCQKSHFTFEEIPIALSVDSKDSTVRFGKEIFTTLRWISIFYIRSLNGYYQKIKFENNYFITADDWGMSPSINKAILELAQKGIVKKVSILSNTDYTHYYLEELKAIKGIKLGLHFNLTFNSLYQSQNQLLIRLLNPIGLKKELSRIKSELELQYKNLQLHDVKIDYIDGHHHCHIYPRIAPIFINFLKEKNISISRVPICWKSFFSSKAILIFLSIAQKNLFKKNGISYSKFYYPNFKKIRFSENFLKKIDGKNSYEIIVHPSSFNDFKMLSINDKYSDQRVQEFEILQGLAN